MNSIDLAKFIIKHRRISEKVLGIFTQEELINLKHRSDKPAVIVNVGKEGQEVGHWVAIYTGEFSEFFDPLGKEPKYYSPAIDSFLSNRNQKQYIYSLTPMQGMNSISCGQFILYFLYYKCHGHSYSNILDTFTDNAEKNDELVIKFVREHQSF